MRFHAIQLARAVIRKTMKAMRFCVLSSEAVAFAVVVPKLTPMKTSAPWDGRDKILAGSFSHTFLMLT